MRGECGSPVRLERMTMGEVVWGSSLLATAEAEAEATVGDQPREEPCSDRGLGTRLPAMRRCRSHPRKRSTRDKDCPTRRHRGQRLVIHHRYTAQRLPITVACRANCCP